MDLQKIGGFLAALRKERGLTQEQLGQAVGVTNKTVSRWETGNYLPPVEMLQAMSELYGVSINEILSGERLTDSLYREKAEENIKSVLTSSFTLKERIDFFKRKWRKEHIFDCILALAAAAGFYIAGAVLDNGLQIVGFLVCVISYGVLNNRMMAYVEARAFDGSGTQ